MVCQKLSAIPWQHLLTWTDEINQDASAPVYAIGMDMYILRPSYGQGITMFATHAPVRVCPAYCGKYCEGPKLGLKLCDAQLAITRLVYLKAFCSRKSLLRY